MLLSSHNPRNDLTAQAECSVQFADWRSLAAMLTDGVRAAGLAGSFSADSLLLQIEICFHQETDRVVLGALDDTPLKKEWGGETFSACRALKGRRGTFVPFNQPARWASRGGRSL